MSFNKLWVTAAAILLAAPAVAQQATDHSKMDHSKMGGMDHSKMMKNTPANPYAQAEMKMHERMMPALGSDASETWVRKMIEHHRGGVETARIAIAQAKDAKVRAMAQKTVTMQNKEIAELQAWLKTNGKKAQ
ncbi:MAG: DUF305 domain-containing protein [Sphingomonadaceae bacterium]|nr:DUF305 domain-containing protein [Sphingomonadaceae bacterium]